MRVFFAATPEIAIPTLEALTSRKLVCGVLTAPDAPSGRGRTLTPSPVKVRAGELGIPVFTPMKLDGIFREEIKPLNAGLLVSFAYGKIFGPKFLELFPLGGVNLHPSLLPRHRGPAPAPAAILSGDALTGLTLQTLALEMDAGDILAQRILPLWGSETAADILEWASETAPELLLGTLDHWETNFSSKIAQDPEKITFCTLLNKADGKIDWAKSAVEIDRVVRAFTPWPGAFTEIQGKRLLVRHAQPASGGEEKPPGTVLGIDKRAGIRVQTGEGVLEISLLQLEGKREASHLDFANGNPNLKGTVLGVI